MNLNKIFLTFVFSIILSSCADYKVEKKKKHFYSSKGFVLIFEDDLYIQKIVNKKINNAELHTMHDILKINTPIKIINPENSKSVETKIYKRANYPKIFNMVISEKIASILELDQNNPYVEIYEIKKNKTFIANQANTFEEEKNVAEKAPIDKIEIDDLSTLIPKNKNKKIKTKNFILIVNDFYYKVSADNLKNELIKKTKMNNIMVKKINNTKYRLLVGPFKNFNALKSAYISLNNLGFEHLNIHNN